MKTMKTKERATEIVNAINGGGETLLRAVLDGLAVRELIPDTKTTAEYEAMHERFKHNAAEAERLLKDGVKCMCGSLAWVGSDHDADEVHCVACVTQGRGKGNPLRLCLDCKEPLDEGEELCCDDCMTQAEIDMMGVECGICGGDYRYEKTLTESASVMEVERDDPDEMLTVCVECWGDPDRVRRIEAERKGE